MNEVDGDQFHGKFKRFLCPSVKGNVSVSDFIVVVLDPFYCSFLSGSKLQILVRPPSLQMTPEM